MSSPCAVLFSAPIAKGRSTPASHAASWVSAIPIICATPKTCESYGKSIRRDDLEGDFEDLLKSLRPSRALVALIRDLFHACLGNSAAHRQPRCASCSAARSPSWKKQIDGFLDKIADAASSTAVTAYERRIERLEHDKLKMRGQLESACATGTAAENLEPALLFFSNPWKLWDSGRSEMRRLVLRLAFCRTSRLLPENRS